MALDQVVALRPLVREPVVLRHLEGLSEEAPARRLGVPAATLRARLRSAYELLGGEDTPDFAEAVEAWRARAKA